MLQKVLAALWLITLGFAQVVLGDACFQIGECRESLFIGGKQTSDEYACLSYCNSHPDCKWMTFNQNTSYCELFQECAILDTKYCTDCISAEKECTTDEPVCWVVGECKGLLHHGEQLSSPVECLELCNATLRCRWFSFNVDASRCSLFITCPSINEECFSCTSGERRCIEEGFSTTTAQPEPPKGMTKLLVATSAENYLQSVEVLNLDQSTPNLICDNLPDIPFGLKGATGQLYQGVTPMICGGKDRNQQNHQECFALTNGVWKLIAKMSEYRFSPASTRLTLASGEEVVLVTGGNDKNYNPVASMEAFNGSHWNSDIFAPMPIPLAQHCLVKVNQTTLLVIGGGDHEDPSDTTYFFNFIDNLWVPGPKLNVSRLGQACGILEWKNDETDSIDPYVVVAGGLNYPDYPFEQLASVEMLSLADPESSWVLGQDLYGPGTSYFSTMIEYENTVILVGGYGGIGGKHLYQLSSPEGPWVEMNQVLGAVRAGHVSFLIPDDIANCHEV